MYWFVVVLLERDGSIIHAVGPFENRYKAQDFVDSLHNDACWEIVELKGVLEHS